VGHVAVGELTAGRIQAVLLDAFGTLVGLDPPLPRITARLAAEGFVRPREAIAAALDAEMRFYRANHDRGRDAASLLALRRECAAVLGEGLGPGAPDLDRLTCCLLDSLEFVLLPDALPALDALAAAGHRLAIVSNWDYDLPAELERLGIADRFEAVAVSAALGVGKPNPEIFRYALDLLGVAPGEAVHCGDQPDRDCTGARAAGVAAILVDREGRLADAPCPRIASLAELPEAVAALDGAASRAAPSR
jgi:HAD superfamily hydrolase (TIGR01509 family)